MRTKHKLVGKEKWLKEAYNVAWDLGYSQKWLNKIVTATTEREAERYLASARLECD